MSEASWPLIHLLLRRPELDVTIATTKGVTALHLAVQKHRSWDADVIALVRKLLGKGANPDAQDASGRSPRDAHCSPEVRELVGE